MWAPGGFEPRTREVNIDRCQCRWLVVNISDDPRSVRLAWMGGSTLSAVSSRRSVWVECGWILKEHDHLVPSSACCLPVLPVLDRCRSVSEVVVGGAGGCPSSGCGTPAMYRSAANVARG